MEQILRLDNGHSLSRNHNLWMVPGVLFHSFIPFFSLHRKPQWIGCVKPKTSTPLVRHGATSPDTSQFITMESDPTGRSQNFSTKTPAEKRRNGIHFSQPNCQLFTGKADLEFVNTAMCSTSNERKQPRGMLPGTGGSLFSVMQSGGLIMPRLRMLFSAASGAEHGSLFPTASSCSPVIQMAGEICLLFSTELKTELEAVAERCEHLTCPCGLQIPAGQQVEIPLTQDKSQSWETNPEGI